MGVEGFLEKALRLKEVKREGWKRRGVEKAESVAEHSFGVAMLCLALGNERKVNVGKAVKMALVHDLGEAIAGDLTPEDYCERAEKIAGERMAVKEIAAELGARGKEIVALWEEFEEGKTKEAGLVRQADKLEMLLQARLYKGRGELKSIKGFEERAREAVKDKAMKRLL